MVPLVVELFTSTMVPFILPILPSQGAKLHISWGTLETYDPSGQSCTSIGHMISVVLSSSNEFNVLLLLGEYDNGSLLDEPTRIVGTGDVVGEVGPGDDVGIIVVPLTSSSVALLVPLNVNMDDGPGLAVGINDVSLTSTIVSLKLTSVGVVTISSVTVTLTLLSVPNSPFTT